MTPLVMDQFLSQDSEVRGPFQIKVTHEGDSRVGTHPLPPQDREAEHQ